MKAILISLQKDMDAIGLKCIHHYLLNNGHDSSLLFLPGFDPSNNRQLEGVRDFVIANDPGFIGMSLMSTEYHKAGCLTRYLKKSMPEIPVIWGGIHPTICPDSCLDNADYVCVGEGEQTALDVARSLEKKEGLRGIRNLCYRENGGMVRNELYPLREDLDEVTFHGQIPDKGFVLLNDEVRPLDLKLFKRYDRYSGRSFVTRISRGCPFACTYCCNNFISNLYKGNRIRRRDIDKVLNEIKEAIALNPGIEYITFMDDCIPAFDKDYLQRFLDGYKKTVSRPFALQSIPVYMSREKLEILKDAGLSWMSLGLQSGSDRVCREIYKRASLSRHFLEASRHIKDLNIAAYYDLILDNPFENEQDKLETVNTLTKIPKPYFMDFYSLVCYHGTELHDRVRREYPACSDEYLEKDYLLPLGTPLNMLIKSAAFMDGRIIRWLVSLYRRDPDGMLFKVLLRIVYSVSMVILAPITYLRVLKLSLRGSYFRVFRVLPTYFKLGIFRYLNQFKGMLASN